MGSQRISNPWGEEGAQQLHLLRSNLIVDCRSRRSRSLLNVFTLNIAISVPPLPSLPFCPPLCQIVHFRAILSTSVPNCPSFSCVCQKICFPFASYFGLMPTVNRQSTDSQPTVKHDVRITNNHFCTTLRGFIISTLKSAH